MRFLSLKDILTVHSQLIHESGGAGGIRDFGMLQSSIAQPFMMFNGKYLYDSIIEKAAAIGYSLIMNHPFVDGNKRIGHAAMELFLFLNGYEIDALIDDQERLILDVASGNISREQLTMWLERHSKPSS
jgi:death-on-curing protein